MKDRFFRMIALDLDDTTLRSDGSLSARTAAALQAAAAAGVEVVVASGRAFDSLPKSVTSLSGVRYAVTGNGCACYEIATGRRLFSATLPTEAVARCLSVLRPWTQLPVTAFWQGVPYASEAYVAHPERFGCRGGVIDYIRRTRRPVCDVFDFAMTHAADLDSLNVLCDTVEHRLALQKELSQIPQICTAASTDLLLEVFSAEAGKHAGLAFLCDCLQIPMRAVAAFGNADNDITMLQWAGSGVAVANASVACLAAADETVAENDADGVAQWIETHILN